MVVSKARPRVLNLDAKGELDTQAYAKLLSVMTCPDSRRDRHAFMESKRRADAAGRDMRPRPGLSTAMRDGAVAGDLLLWMLQEHLHETRTSLSDTLPLVRAALLRDGGFTNLGGFPAPENLIGEERKRINRGETGRIHRRAMLNRFRSFRPVAHLWAACLLAHNPDAGIEALPSTPVGLGRMISIADAIADIASTVQLPMLSPRTLLPRVSTWRVRIPQHLREAGKLELPPVSSKARSTVSR